MLVDRLQDAGKNQQKLIVLVRRFARIKQIDPVIRLDRPVVVFA